MKRVLSVTLVGMLLLAGCAGAGPLQTGSGDAVGSDTPTISVAATGTATADPDLAVLNLAVEATADGADGARERVARNVSEVRTALDDAGVPDANVTTTAFGIAPVYDYSGDERRVVGYRAVHSLAVETAPARAGELVDVTVGAGATRVDGVQFTLGEERRAALRATALDRAMSAARTDADGIAAAADLSVTGVRSASTGAEFSPYPDARFAESADGTTIQPAPVTVTVSVDVTYAAS
jgi:uncharacterized protein YggE